MSRYRLMPLLLVMLLSASPLLVSTPATAQAPLTGIVSPQQGPPATLFLFSAIGFEAGADVAYWITAPNGEVIGDALAYRGNANSEGRLTWEWRAPGDALAGTWSMVAQQIDDRQRTAVILFGITPASPPPAPPEPTPEAPDPATQASVEPPVGTRDTTFRFLAAGFEAGEPVSYWFNAPDNTVVGNADAFVTTADSTGRIDIFWRPRFDGQPGGWSAVARGLDSQVEQVAFFEMRP